MGVSAQRTRARRSVHPAGGVVHSAAWVARLAVEALQLGVLAVTAAIAYLAGKMLRRVNRKGLLGWGVIVLAALLFTAVIVELLELM
jgi:hypothetical protein